MRSTWIALIVLLSFSSPAALTIRPYRSVYSYGLIDSNAHQCQTMLKLINDTNLYVKYTYWGSNWFVQHHEWATEYTNIVSLYHVHTSYHFARTNNGVPVTSWDYPVSDDIAGTSWGYGNVVFVDSLGRYSWFRSRITLQVLKDQSNPSPPPFYYLMMGYTPFRFWSTNNQSPDVYGRYKINSTNLPVTITINPQQFLASGCNDIYFVNGVPTMPEYWFWSSREWTGSFTCSETYSGQPIDPPIIPIPDVCNPPVPEGVPSPLITFTNQVQQFRLAPQPPGNGCTNCPYVPGTTHEDWVKTLEFTGQNQYSDVLFLESTNLTDWELGGLAENITNKTYRYTDSKPSDGVRFYKIIPAN